MPENDNKDTRFCWTDTRSISANKQCQESYSKTHDSATATCYYSQPMSSLHARIAGITLILLVLWGITSLRAGDRANDLGSVEIVVEHADSASLTLIRTRDGLGLTDIRNDGQGPIAVSIPEEWERDEVRGAPLASITVGDASLGFRRWVIPRGATVSFRVRETWNASVVRNASKDPLRLRVITVNLEEETTDSDTFLITDTPLSLSF